MSQPIADIFEFCPRCGTPADAVGVNPFRCKQCAFSHFFSPVAAVAAIVPDADGAVLLLTRAREPGLGKFGLPGGFVDPGERLEDALAREILEETNLEPTSTTYLTSFPNTYDYRGVNLPVTDTFFVCHVSSFESLARQAREVAAFQFVQLTDEVLSNMAFASNRRALEVFLTRGEDEGGVQR